MKKTHLTLDDRVRIESLLNEGFSIRYIAERLDKAPSTISREIKNHTQTVIPKRCDCTYFNSCTLHHVCGASGCNRFCKNCAKAKKYCTDYVTVYCDSQSERKPSLCNGCKKRGYCHFTRHFYDAKKADADYRNTLIHSRDGFDLTAAQFQQINDVVSPLVKRGQSLYHIVQTNRDTLPVSESTLRRLIALNELDVINLDLPETVKRRPRKKTPPHPAPSQKKNGRLYADYLAYLQNNDVPVVQMDCVEGTSSDKAAILTLHFSAFHMQLAYILDEHTSACVVATLDILEQALGKELFAACFPLILTDNGHEFSDIAGIERSLFGGLRTKLFFCEPNRSDQKGQCENNHKLIRNIIPKGTSIDAFSQFDMVLLTNHINSYVRKSLFGKCPYDVAMASLPDDFFILLGMERIPPDEVLLKPALLKRTVPSG